MLLSSLVNKESNKQYQYAKMLNGHTPVFSQFGQSIYASDVVQMCIDKTAREISKLRPKHIRTDAGGLQTIPKSSFNRLFKYKPNELMTTRDFLEKVTWLLFLNSNCFIYPKYNLIQESSGGYTREYTGFYPLNPTVVTFLQDPSNNLFIKLQFANGSDFTIAYSDIIHLRKRYSVNEVMGGGFDGKPDNAALLKVLQINDTVLQGLDKAIKSSLSVRGIVRINTLIGEASQEEERKRLEAAIDLGTSSIIALDLKGDYIPINPDPKLIDQSTLEFLQNKVLNWYDMPVKIFTGEFDDGDYQAWYESALEPIVIGLGQAFTPATFSSKEISHGDEIVFYQRDMMYLSTKSKLELIKTAGEMGILQDNQKLALLGYPPIPGGERYTQSLNFVDKSIINEYQLKKAGAPRVEAEKD